MNEQLDPKSPSHLRANLMVSAWINDYKQRTDAYGDCARCGWPHASVSPCGWGATFGQVRLGGDLFFVDASNVARSCSCFSVLK